MVGMPELQVVCLSEEGMQQMGSLLIVLTFEGCSCTGGQADGEGHGGGALHAQVPRVRVHLHLRRPWRHQRAVPACGRVSFHCPSGGECSCSPWI